MRLANKVAIISGAASGMGAATARRFAKEGAKVVIADMLSRGGQQLSPSQHHSLDWRGRHLRSSSTSPTRPAGNKSS